MTPTPAPRSIRRHRIALALTSLGAAALSFGVVGSATAFAATPGHVHVKAASVSSSKTDRSGRESRESTRIESTETPSTDPSSGDPSTDPSTDPSSGDTSSTDTTPSDETTVDLSNDMSSPKHASHR